MNLRLAVNSPRLFVGLLALACGLSATESKPGGPEKAAKPAADSMLGKEPGQVRDDNRLKMKLVWCPPGKFRMGSPHTDKIAQDHEKPQVNVVLTKGFWLGQTEVTQGHWEKVMGTTPWKIEQNVREGTDYPATFVSWGDAVAFCKKLTHQEREAERLPSGWEFTLPTEAQWEYACRAGTTTTYSFGDDESQLSDYGWWGGLVGDGNAKTEPHAHRVGLKKANQWGLHDMHGNLLEWCSDWYGPKLSGGTDPTGPVIPFANQAGSGRVVRGGSWYRTAWFCRSAYRNAFDTSVQNDHIGFRVAMSPAAGN
jgi:formylglycine-generating enzyme required for sulfatase activity